MKKIFNEILFFSLGVGVLVYLSKLVLSNLSTNGFTASSVLHLALVLAYLIFAVIVAVKILRKEKRVKSGEVDSIGESLVKDEEVVIDKVRVPFGDKVLILAYVTKKPVEEVEVEVISVEEEEVEVEVIKELRGY